MWASWEGLLKNLQPTRTEKIRFWYTKPTTAALFSKQKKSWYGLVGWLGWIQEIWFSGFLFKGTPVPWLQQVWPENLTWTLVISSFYGFDFVLGQIIVGNYVFGGPNCFGTKKRSFHTQLRSLEKSWYEKPKIVSSWYASTQKSQKPPKIPSILAMFYIF